MGAGDAADADLLRRCAEQLGSVRGGPAEVIDALVGLTDLLLGNVETAIPPLRTLLLAARDGRVDGTVERLMAGFGGVLIGAGTVR